MADIFDIYRICEQCQGTGELPAGSGETSDCPYCDEGKKLWGEMVERV